MIANAQKEEHSTVDFRSIYDAEVPYVWRYLQYMGVPSRDIEDKVQDVFVALYRCWDRYDPSRPVRPWLTGIGFRVASDYKRKAGNYREIMHCPVEAVDRTHGPEMTTARREAWDLIEAALEILDPDRRAVFVLHDIEGQTVPAISDALGVPVNTLYSRLRHARERFKAAVERLKEPRPPQKGGRA